MLYYFSICHTNLSLHSLPKYTQHSLYNGFGLYVSFTIMKSVVEYVIYHALNNFPLISVNLDLIYYSSIIESSI